MRISLKWMMLSASAAILAPTLAANAQVADFKLNVPQPISEIPQELQPESTHPSAKVTLPLAANLVKVSQTTQTAISSPLVTLPPKEKQPLMQLPRKVAAELTFTEAAIAKPKLEILPLKEITDNSLANPKAIARLVLEPDTISPVALAKALPLISSISNAPKIATNSTDSQTLPKTDASTASPAINPANKKIAYGLDPTAPLVVPTTPSQVRIERTQPITLEEALALANSKNRDIIQSRIAVERARGVLQEAEAARLPTVNAQASYSFTDSAGSRLGNISAPSFVQPSSTTSQPLSGTVGASYNIYTSGLVEANIRAAENQLRIAEVDLNRVSQVVRLQVVTAYYNLQNTDESVRIQQKSVENAQRSLKDTQALERAGVGTRFDVLQSQVQLANNQQALLNAQASQLVARRDLVRQLEYPTNLDLVAADKIAPAPDWKLSLEDTVLLALKNRAELDIQRLNREVARDRARASLARLGPQVNLTASFDLADNFNQVGGVALGYRLGAGVSMALFDGGVANAQVNQFKADQALAESRFEQSAGQARFDVEQAYITLQSRRGQIDASTKAVEQATEALRLSRLRLSAGVGTQLEVLTSEQQLTQADVNNLQAIIGFNLQLANLQRAINGL